MTTAAAVLGLVAGILHVVVFVLESLLWRREAVWRILGARSEEEAGIQEGVFFNQGFYNLFLAAGALVGAVWVAREGSATLLTYCCLFMVGAGAVLLINYPRLWRGALLQIVPAGAALVALALR